MSDLIINNNIINTPIGIILKQLRSELNNGKLKDIIFKGNDYVVTCPNHKNGFENNPSCFVYCGDSPDIEYGKCHCFTCGESWPLYKFVSLCFDTEDVEFGKEWLVSRFGQLYSNVEYNLSDILFKKETKKYLDENILDNFDDYHPYLESRHLSKETCTRFKVKYDSLTNSIVFPVFDTNNRLSFLTRRSVNEKKFLIDKGADKSCIYLLNEVVNNNIDTVVVVESQINCLTLWENGIPSIALFGAGTSDEQMRVLNKSPIRNYVLAYDNDAAGKSGAYRFKKNIRKDVFVDEVELPIGRDVNDLTSEEIHSLFNR